jgi:hypothetical protein
MITEEKKEEKSLNFIEEIIEADLAIRKIYSNYNTLSTRTKWLSAYWACIPAFA